jgi:putative addiction module killer protein
MYPIGYTTIPMITLIRTAEFSEWLTGLKDATAKAAILNRMDRATKGNFGDSKSLQGGLYEMRIDVGPGYRVYYTQRGLAVYVLLLGGDKRKQDRDIKRAREMMQQLE